MGKALIGMIVILGLWVGMEIAREGPARAFGGLFEDIMGESAEAEVVDERSTARRAGDAVERARDEAVARRERMLGE